MFGRFEYYRIYEYVCSLVGKTYKFLLKFVEDISRKRGRLFKYFRNIILVISKVELIEFEILNFSCENSTVINGFKKFEEDNFCLDELCLYRGKEYFYCVRFRCY